MSQSAGDWKLQASIQQKKLAKTVKVERAGKGAVQNYGRRRRPVSERLSLEAARAELRSHRRQNTGAPSAPLPESHTFSQPSSSFNASSWVSSGVAPPLAGRNAAGLGEGYLGRPITPKHTALIMPGQGSQYVTMAKDLYESFASARKTWHAAEAALASLHKNTSTSNVLSTTPRDVFEKTLEESAARAESEFGAPSSDPHWLRKLVFGGEQLILTQPENAMPAILVTSLAFFNVLRDELGAERMPSLFHMTAGHGQGVYAALVATGRISLADAVRLMRIRGFEAKRCEEQHPRLFPPGCERPASVYETWGFTNAGSGKGGHLVLDDATLAGSKGPRWKGTQVSAIVVRSGSLQAAMDEVSIVMRDIQRGSVPGIARDEFVAVSSVNSHLQIVLSGTRVGVNYACDRLMFKRLGARAVNLPIGGPFHTSLVDSASEAYGRVIDVLPMEMSDGTPVVSSVHGRLLSSVEDVRAELRDGLNLPVNWLESIQTLLEQGVQRFVCLGPGRTIAQQLSKELAFRERHASTSQTELSAYMNEQSDYEVWSVSTAEGVQQLVQALRPLPR
mgnify:FL=1